MVGCVTLGDKQLRMTRMLRLTRHIGKWRSDIILDDLSKCVRLCFKRAVAFTRLRAQMGEGEEGFVGRQEELGFD